MTNSSSHHVSDNRNCEGCAIKLKYIITKQPLMMFLILDSVPDHGQSDEHAMI